MMRSGMQRRSTHRPDSPPYALYGYGCTTHKHKYQLEAGEPFADMNHTLAGTYARGWCASRRQRHAFNMDSFNWVRGVRRPVLIVRNAYDWMVSLYRCPWDTVYPPFNHLGGRRRRAAVHGRAGPAQLRRAVSYQPQQHTPGVRRSKSGES
jgi:hypothetical protein